jgi:hypothetical membrane protein
MESLIELLKNGNWVAWLSVVFVALLVLLVSVKCIIKLGKIVFILLLLAGAAFGLVKIFPEQAAPIMEKLQQMWQETEEAPPAEE